MIQMNLFTKSKQTHRLQKQTMVTKGERGGGGINQEVGINIYTPTYMKQIINNDLLYTTGDSIQYSVIIYMGKDSEKAWIYVYMNHCAVQVTQHCKSSILQCKIN